MTETKVTETKLNDSQFELNGKIVTVDFDYDGKAQGWKVKFNGESFSSNTVKAFDKELYNKVEAEVSSFEGKRKEILANRAELKRQQNLREHEEEINEFKDFVESVVPENFWDLKPIFQTPREDKWHTTLIKFEGERWELEYKPKKSIGIYHTHLVDNKTPWILEFSYGDKRRYKKIDTAVKRIHERLEIRNQNKTQAEEKTEALQQLADKTGMSIKTETNWHRRGGSRSYKTETLYLVNEVDGMAIKTYIGYYNPEKIKLGTTTITKTIKVGGFEATQKTTIESEFEDVTAYVHFIQELMEMD